MKICVLGLGYVGATTMACLAELGHHMIGVDVRPEKVEKLRQGQSPVVEPGVDELLNKHLATGLIRATSEVESALAESDACFVCVGTPSDLHGGIDSTQLVNVITEIAKIRAKLGLVRPVFMRSTALPQVHQRLMALIERQVGQSQDIAYTVFPEFLREGVAVADFFDPPKVVFGPSDETARGACQVLAEHFPADKTFFTSPETAAMVKYVDNCFHAVKVTFANEVGIMAKAMQVDSRQVMDIFMQDKKLNISTYYLKPGPAFGGSCLPKDLRAVNHWCGRNAIPIPMLGSVLNSNQTQLDDLAERIFATNAQKVGFFGLAFKEGTDDLRESPMVTLAEKLYGRGKELLIYDPALTGSELVGANLNYALQAMPHFYRLLTADAAQVVDMAEVIISSRPPAEIAWQDLPWRAGQRVFDLWGKEDLGDIAAKVEGLYW